MKITELAFVSEISNFHSSPLLIGLKLVECIKLLNNILLNQVLRFDEWYFKVGDLNTIYNWRIMQTYIYNTVLLLVILIYYFRFIVLISLDSVDLLFAPTFTTLASKTSTHRKYAASKNNPMQM